MRRLLLGAAAMLCFAAPSNAHVDLLAPNGGETLQPGTVYTIRWQVRVGHNTRNWDLWYSVSGPSGPWIPIAMDLPPGNITTGAMHGYQWTVPNTPSTRVRVRVRQDNSNIDYEDVSDSDLTITTPPASYTPYGQGCAGGAGVPVLGAQPGSTPIIGTTFTARLTNLSGGSTGAFLVAGTGRTPGTSLSSFGLVGCRSFVTADAFTFVPAANGLGTWSASIPNQPTLVGVELFHQALVLDPGAPNPARAAVTNAAHAFVSDH